MRRARYAVATLALSLGLWGLACGTDDGTPADPADAGSGQEDPLDVDAGVPDAGGGGEETIVGQCGAHEDCATGVCMFPAPGGLCSNCTADTDCAEGHTCSTFGFCNQTCQLDEDCPPGMTCSTGQCAMSRCSADTDCPDGLRCGNSGFCNRIMCGTDADCAEGWACRHSWCIEPELQ